MMKPNAPRLYSGRRIRRALAKCAAEIARIAAEYRLPCACMQAVVHQELSALDLFDLLADGAVALYWLRFSLHRRLRLPPPRHGKRDSSTGWAQVFAATAIRSIRFAQEKGITTWNALGLDHLPDPQSPADLGSIWKRLHRDRTFNLRLCALTLLTAAEEMNGSTDFLRFSPEEMKRAFTRYNASTRTVTPYGEDAYRLYLAYAGEEPAARASCSA